MISKELLDILVCPETKQALHLLDDASVQRINQAITAGVLQNRRGEPITETIQSALLREDGKWAYAIRDDIPIMLIDEAFNPAS